MPYLEPRKTKAGWVLPKRGGGVHRSHSGSVVHFKTKAAAKRVGKRIMYEEGKRKG